MADIQLVLTDFDGTVVEFGKHLVSDAVRQAVIACEDQGIQMVPVTGRPYKMARPVLELLGFDGVGVFDNGATIQNCKTGEVIWSQWLEVDAVRRVTRVLAPVCIFIDYTESHEEYESADNNLEHIEELVVAPASHIFALIKRESIDDVLRQLSEIKGITFYTAPSTRDNEPDAVCVQVNHIEADKFHGVNALRKISGISKEHTLAIGDGDNDLALFKNANITVAMGNASDALKAEADHVVASVQEDGFVQAMQQFVLKL